jgi:hypothetical protein
MRLAWLTSFAGTESLCSAGQAADDVAGQQARLRMMRVVADEQFVLELKAVEPMRHYC